MSRRRNFARIIPLLLTVVALMVSLLMIKPETASAQEPPPDDYTMNDIWESGSYGRVSVGSAGEGNIERSGDRDFFALGLSETGTYRIKVTGSGDADALANPRLYGVFKYANDLECSGAYDDPAVRSYAFTADTTNGNVYTVGVRAEDGGTGSYRLTLIKTDDTATGCDTKRDSRDTTPTPEPAPQSPGTPQGLEATAASHTQIDLSWTAPEGEPTSYEVEWSEDGKTNWQGVAPSHSGTEAAYSHTDLTAETTYYYRVKAENDNGAGEWSETVSATTEERPNTPATGAPAVSGTARVGETLTADTSGIADEDGLSNAGFSYQWQADGADIPGATDSSYTLADADVGKAISVTVAFTDDEGNEESLISAATAAVEAKPNTPATGLPSIGGTTQVGETLTADTSGIADEDGLTNASFSYQWMADDVDIPGATDSSYTLADADVGKAISVTVAFTDDEGNEESLISAATAAVVAKPNSPATGVPSISGTAQVGETLTADTSGIADEDGLTNASFSYQWMADDVDISGATDATYTLAEAVESTAISVMVSFSDDAGNAEILTSAATAAVVAKPNTPATGLPSISGTAQVGETLTADTSGIADEDGLTNASFSYQWMADDVDISGATDASYTLAEAVESTAISVMVSFSDDAGNAEILTSAATAAVVAKPNTPATGLPSIGGTTQVGETLTADTSGIADEDGLTNASFSYQWMADDVDISGATDASYTLAEAVESTAISVMVSFSDDAGNAEILTSAATAAVAMAQPQERDITGLTLTSEEPGTLTATWDAPTPIPNGYYIKWDYIKWDNESAQSFTAYTTDSSHTFTDLRQGQVHEVRVRARYERRDGPWSANESITVAWYSADIPGVHRSYVINILRRQTALVLYAVNWLPADDNPETLDLTLRGDVVNAGGKDFDRCEQEGMGEDHNLYIIDEMVEGFDLRYGSPVGDCSPGFYTIITTVRDGSGRILTRFLDDFRVIGGPVACIGCGLRSMPTISGDPIVGETLTADTSGISIPPLWRDVQFAYQWISHDGTEETEIPGATNETYSVAQSDIGKLIKVRVDVTYTDEKLGLDSDGELVIVGDATFSDHAKSLPTQVVVAAVSAPSTTNSPATGTPAITGTAQVGETLTAATTGIADEDGLTNVAYSYQWLFSRDTEIDGAKGSTYTLQASDEGKIIKVRVTFTDDAGNGETLTSVATATVAAAPPPPLTVSLENTPSSHDGENAFTFDVRFSEELRVSYRTLRDHAFTVTGGTVQKAGRLEQGSNMGWRITVSPNSNEEVNVVLPATGDCDDDGAICTEDGRKLSGRLELSVSGPESQQQPVQNTLATGAPTISGTVQVGEMLTVDTSGIGDEDGLDDAAFAYQWQADGTDIQNATGSTYTLLYADKGKAISVVVSFTDDAGNEESLTSAATAAVEAKPNTPATGAPTIGGKAQVWETLTADTSGIGDEDGLDDAVFAYQWQADGTDIQDATGSRYTMLYADKGKAISVTVTFTDDAGNEESLTSAATAAVEAKPNTPATGAPTIGGKAQVGETLTVDTSGISDADGLTHPNYISSYIYDWIRVGGGTQTIIPGATTSTYTLVAADQGNTIKVEVTFTDDAANDETLTSAATDAVEARPNSPATGQPAIGGTALVGETLTVDTSGIADEDGLTNASFGYQWVSSDGGADSEIGGATGSTYTLASGDVGRPIKVRVSFSDDRGHGEELTSAATAAVEALEPDLAYVFMVAFTGAWGTYPGDTITLSSARVRNDGTGTSPATTLRYYQSTDETIEASDTEVGTEAVAELAASASFNGGVVEVTAPSSPGTYYYGVCVDAVAGESDTTNNCSSSGIRIEVLARNTAPTGLPSISGTAQVGETLTADVSGIADADGLTNAVFSYQWLADGADISGATSDTYKLVDDDEGKATSVAVSFTDDAGNDETLTSAASAAVEAAPLPPLTALIENAAASHDGEGVFTFELRFSEEFGISYKTLRDHAFTVTGGTVKKAKRLEQGSNMGWRITVRPDGNGDVTVVLPETTDCDAQRAICTEDGRMLSHRLELSVSGPGQ